MSEVQREIVWASPVGRARVPVRAGMTAPARFRLEWGEPYVDEDSDGDPIVVGVVKPSHVATFDVLPGGTVVLDEHTYKRRPGRILSERFVDEQSLESRGRDHLPPLMYDPTTRGFRVALDPDSVDWQDVRRRAAVAARALTTSRGRPGASVERIREAAEVHRTTTTGSPLQAVADEFGVSTATASRWMKQAREMGLDVGESGSRGQDDARAKMLREVAEIVLGVESGPIGKTVASMQGVSEATAWKRIKAAREAGYLPARGQA